MRTIGVIGGTGALSVADGAPGDPAPVGTPYGDTSSPLLSWQTERARIYFIARHGLDSNIAPHRVNYRANIWALHERSPDIVVGLNAVGGIAPTAIPARLIVPDQLIDYTWGRKHTYFDGDAHELQHVELTEPFSSAVRAELASRADECALDFYEGGTYAVTQGPRLETAAEIDRLERDGCDIVGMTAMPEAGLARELGLQYAICAVVVNWAAGRAPAGEGIHDEIGRFLAAGMQQVQRLLTAL